MEAWAAGFFEGEGCISKRSQRPAVRLAVVNKDLEMLHRFQAVVRCGKIYKSSTNGCWQWVSVRTEDVQRAMEMLWPWLSDRRRSTYLRLEADRLEAHHHRYGYGGIVPSPHLT